MEKKLPEGWEWKRLGELGKIESGGTPRRGKQEYWKDGSIPWVKISDISDKYILKTSEKITKEGLENSSAKMFSKGSLLISIFATLGDVGILNIDAACNQALASIQLNNNNVDRNYLYYLLKSLKKHFEKIGRGVAQNNINLTILKSTKIPLPPLETQRKIVAILEKADETKRLRMQADGLTTQLLQSVFLEMFGDPAKNPKRWEIYKLQDVSEIRSGVTKGRKLAGKPVVSVPYLRVANVQDGYLDLNEIKTIEVLLSDVDKYALLEGDVLLTEGGDPDKLGRGAVLHDEIPNCIHQNHIFRVRVNKEYLVPEFLSMLIGSAYGKMYFLKSAKQTTGIATINSTQLKKFPVLAPPTELQHKFAQIVEKVEAMRQNQKQSQQEIDNLFNALTQKAFAGELIT